MNCPICVMDLVISDRRGIEIDYCPKCRGIWLDRGELDKILERSAAEIQPVRPVDRQGHSADPEHQDQYGHGKGKHGENRRRSMLNELFDIFG